MRLTIFACLFFLSVGAYAQYSIYSTVEPAANNPATADYDLDGYKLICDDDQDTYLQCSADDVLDVFVGGTKRIIASSSRADITNTGGTLRLSDGTNVADFTTIGDGQIEIRNAAGNQFLRLGPDGTLSTSSNSILFSDTKLLLGTPSAGFYLYQDGTYTQGIVAVGTSAGRQFIITDAPNHTKDHDHATQTNPTLYIHSATDPDSDNTQWVSVTHDQTDAVVETGTGAFLLNAGGGFRLPGVIGATPAAPVTCGATYAGVSVYVDDNDDSGAAAVCVCIATPDDASYDWVRMDDHSTACPFF